MKISHIMVDKSANDFIKLFQKDIPAHELKSFIAFLRLTNAYDAFFNEFNADRLKLFISIHSVKYAYYKIFNFIFDNTEKQYSAFWHLIDLTNYVRWLVLYGLNYYMNQWSIKENNQNNNKKIKKYIDNLNDILDEKKGLIDKKTYNILSEYIEKIKMIQ